MNTPRSSSRLGIRMRSPSKAPPVSELCGSHASTATVRPADRITSISLPISVLLPTPPLPVTAMTWRTARARTALELVQFVRRVVAEAPRPRGADHAQDPQRRQRQQRLSSFAITLTEMADARLRAECSCARRNSAISSSGVPGPKTRATPS